MKNALFLQNILTNATLKTLAVGGFVRDYLLKIPTVDIDLATTATPDQIITILTKNKIKYSDSARHYGQITAFFKDKQYQITTLRQDIDTFGRSANVKFIKSFEKDALRRDFTVNALFMDLNNYQIFDYINAMPDIKAKKLKFIGNPATRINEDFLRILRFYRFMCKGFSPDLKTSKIVLKLSPLMALLSKERIYQELFKMLGDDFNKILKIKEVSTLLIPELLPLVSLYPSLFEKIKVHGSPMQKMAQLLKLASRPFSASDKLVNNFCYSYKLSNLSKKQLLSEFNKLN